MLKLSYCIIVRSRSLRLPSNKYIYIICLHFSEMSVFLSNDSTSGPLGIHVVPDYSDSDGIERGLLVQRIEPGGRVARDGRLSIYDRIVEINGVRLLDMPFQRWAHSIAHGTFFWQIDRHTFNAGFGLRSRIRNDTNDKRCCRFPHGFISNIIYKYILECTQNK